MYKACDPSHPDAERPWCYVTGGEECSDAKPSKDVPGMFWKRCTLADEAEGTPVKPGVPDVVKGEEADHGIPSSKECKCKATWKWKKNVYKGCDASHPEAERNWCYINGGSECPGAKKSKDTEGMFWKRCDADTDTQGVATSSENACKCQSSWSWKKKMYKACDPAHPDAERPWCYVNGGEECEDAKESKDVPGMFWKRCTLSDESPGTPVKSGVPAVVKGKKNVYIPSDKECKCKATWKWKKNVYKGCDASHPEAERNWCYINGGSECPGAKKSKDTEGMFWKRCDSDADTQTPEAEKANACKCQSSWSWKKKMYKACDPSHPDAERPWCYVTGGEECSDAKPSKDVPGMFWKRCTLADEAEGTPVKPGVPDVVKGEEADHGIPSSKECKCKATWKWKKNVYKGCDASHPEAERNWCYINGGSECPGAKKSKDTEGMFWKRCDADTDTQGVATSSENACKCQSSWSWKKKMYKACDPAHPDAERPWCYVNGGEECEDAKESKDVPGMFWKRCTLSDESPGTPVKSGVPAVVKGKKNVYIPSDKECKCKATWKWKKNVYKGCDASHPEAERNWCYINGGSECPGAKKSKDTEGMFWKRCDADIDTQTPEAEKANACKCQSSWSWKKKMYKACDPSHPDAERPWCYVTGGEECSDAKPSKDVSGMFWKRCTLADEAEGTPVKPGVPDVVKGEDSADRGIPSDKDCKCKATWKWKKNMYKGCDPSHPEAERNWCYINGGSECTGAKKSKDTEGMFWKRCDPDTDTQSPAVALADACKCQSSWSWKKKMYKACDPSHPDAERPWCYVDGGKECTDAKPSEDVPGMFWKRCTLSDEAPGTPIKAGVPAVVAGSKYDSSPIITGKIDPLHPIVNPEMPAVTPGRKLPMPAWEKSSEQSSGEVTPATCSWDLTGNSCSTSVASEKDRNLVAESHEECKKACENINENGCCAWFQYVEMRVDWDGKNQRNIPKMGCSFRTLGKVDREMRINWQLLDQTQLWEFKSGLCKLSDNGFVKEKAKDYYENDVEECGKFMTKDEIEKACKETTYCVGYTLASKYNQGAQPDATGKFPWCMKFAANKESLRTPNHVHDYYKKEVTSTDPNRFKLNADTNGGDANIGSCGQYDTRAELEAACLANDSCAGYTMDSNHNTGASMEDGKYPWCLKLDTSENSKSERSGTDYYEKVKEPGMDKGGKDVAGSGEPALKEFGTGNSGNDHLWDGEPGVKENEIASGGADKGRLDVMELDSGNTPSGVSDSPWDGEPEAVEIASSNIFQSRFHRLIIWCVVGVGFFIMIFFAQHTYKDDFNSRYMKLLDVEEEV